MSAPKRPLTIFGRTFRLPGERIIALAAGPSVYGVTFLLGVVGSYNGAPTLNDTFDNSGFPQFTFIFTVWQWGMAAIALAAYFIDRVWARSTEIFFNGGLLGQFFFYDALLIYRAITTDNNPDPSYPAVYSLFSILALGTRLIFAFNEATILRVITDANRVRSDS